jgi:hypothetical protein
MTRESTMPDGRQQLNARELMGILSEMWPAAADKVGKIRTYGDGKVSSICSNLSFMIEIQKFAAYCDN